MKIFHRGSNKGLRKEVKKHSSERLLRNIVTSFFSEFNLQFYLIKPPIFTTGDGVLEEILKSFLSLFVIMSAFASIPVFLSLTRKMDDKQKAQAVSYAVGIAAIVLFVFLFFGQAILSVFGIDFQSLKIAGGIVLSILGVELVLGLSFTRKEHEFPPGVVLIGTPLLSGPGVIVTTVIFVQEYGYVITAIAALAALALSWIILWSSRYFVRLLGNYGISIISRVTGILLVAVAVEFVVAGVKAII